MILLICSMIFLFHRKIRVTFFIAKKVTKNASDPKNSLNHSGICSFSWFAFSPFPISLVPLFGFMAKKWPVAQLEQFWVTVLYLFEMIFTPYRGLGGYWSQSFTYSR